MKYIALTVLLALAACENPVTHFTEDPPKPKHHIIDCRDPRSPTGEPTPPGYRPDTSVTCTRGD